MLIAIIACEVGFWVAIVLGLLFRYPLNMPRLGAIFLYSTPLIDLALLVFTILHLRSGAQASFTHGFSALYISFSLAFGKQVIAWADRTYRKFKGLPVPSRKDTHPLKTELVLFGRAFLACACSVIIIEVIIFSTGSTKATEETLHEWHHLLVKVLIIWFFTGPVWEFFKPSAKSSEDSDTNSALISNNSEHDKNSVL